MAHLRASLEAIKGYAPLLQHFARYQARLSCSYDAHSLLIALRCFRVGLDHTDPSNSSNWTIQSPKKFKACYDRWKSRQAMTTLGHIYQHKSVVYEYSHRRINRFAVNAHR